MYFYAYNWTYLYKKQVNQPRGIADMLNAVIGNYENSGASWRAL